MSASNLRVVFVCTGNTCRSPMAEGLFREAAGALEDVEVQSAGIAAHPGGPASRDTIALLRERGIELDGFQSRMVDEAILSRASHVFCMTRGHLETLEMLYPEFTTKYSLVCDFTEIEGRVGRDVPDPIGQGRKAYERVAECLDRAIVGILGFLQVERGRNAG